uniref:Uncharacterized protein n=1 Tax=Ceramothamnion japonicum TaxID=218448 RepID=A0A1C9CDG9_CERJP|nr:hypothetical protein Ceram_131 [Ceramium japonicum]AOM66407.1 hypothetical protein Ceram_131 [Ceramium japonicum]
MFRIYLLIAITILLPICYFITRELVSQVIYCFVLLKNLFFMPQNNHYVDDMNCLVRYCILGKQWFKCIIILHFYHYYHNVNNNKLLGICFHELSYIKIALYYYVRALQNENDIELLQKLLLVYRDLKDDVRMSQICDKIRQIDPNHKILFELNL